ncbi:MAG: hypothetical protein ACLU4J_05215 [Butyricimonas paravirosa]
MDALKAYKLHEGYIVTLDQEDVFYVEDFVIKVIPSYKFMNEV